MTGHINDEARRRRYRCDAVKPLRPSNLEHFYLTWGIFIQ